VPALGPTAVPLSAAPRRWVGGLNGLSAKLSQGNGLGAEAPSQNPPDPHRSAARRIRRSRLTTRPDREPGLTGHSPWRVSPPALSNGHGHGNECVSGPAGALTPAQPPRSAEWGRRSPRLRPRL
jgi:hypothetical protein